mgnify:CR=1 FL=1
MIDLNVLNWIVAEKSTIWPRSSYFILYSKLLSKMGHYFLDIQYDDEGT